MTYETISINELTNRAANVRQAGDCGIIDTPETFFSAQYWNESRKAWWNAFETTEQAKAESTVAQWEKQGSPLAKRIVIVVAKPEPTKEDQRTMADEIIALLAEVEAAPETVEEQSESVEASTAFTDVVVKAAKTYIEWNKVAHRYEAELDGILFCVEENTFADRLYAACSASPDDEYRIWSVLTWLSSWDFSGKQPGVYALEVAHA